MKSGFFILFSIYWFQEVNLSANAYATEAVDGIGIEVNNPRSELLPYLVKQQFERLLTTRSCVTFDGQPGFCQTVQDCYPYTKLHQSISPLETWIIGTRGTCHFVEASGRHVYGVCCRSRYMSLQPLNKASEIDVGNQEDGQLMWDPNSVPFTRIVNGKNADAGEFPFMAAILERGHTFCGGSLLDANHILTAAHCVSGYSVKQISQWIVVLGMIDINEPEKVVRRIKKVIVHKGFDYIKMQNDIALLVLDSPVEFSSQVSPVCLDGFSKTEQYDGKDAVTAGWGQLGENEANSKKLQKVILQIKSLDDCRQNLDSKAPGGVVDQYICAWAPNKDSCTGDSGGPLLIDSCQVGIVSWGVGCATSSYGVYARISSFRDWIDRNKDSI